MNIKKWSASPSGGAITVNGVDAATGEPVKVRGVLRIESGHVPTFWPGRTRLVVQALLAGGERHTLV